MQFMFKSIKIKDCTLSFTRLQYELILHKIIAILLVDNQCCSYKWPSHCKDSKKYSIKNSRKFNTNSQLQTQFSQRDLGTSLVDPGLKILKNII